MYRFIAAIGLAVLFTWPENCVAQAAEDGPVRAGDRWTYDVKDEVTGDLKYTLTVVVVDVGSKEINTRTYARGRDRPQTIVYDLNWNRIDDGIWKSRPSDGSGVQLPLQVGKTWRFENQSAHLQTGTSLRTTGQSKVVAGEKVTTVADTFDTFKVEIAMRQVNSNDQTKASALNILMWYAPAVNRWVRRTVKVMNEGRLRDSFTEELTDYSRKP
jgi:hypothetical protein